MIRLGKKFGWLLFISGVLVCVVCILLFAAQVVGWLQTGTWTYLPFRNVFDANVPSTECVVAQRIIEGFFDLPMAGVIFVAGLIIVNIGLTIIDHFDRRETEYWRQRLLDRDWGPDS